MEIAFDRGTIVLKGAADIGAQGSLVACAQAAGFTWDPRTLIWRAPAHTYSTVVRNLRETGVQLIDRVEECAWNTTARLDAPLLRSYQEDALLAWEMAGRRGTVVLPTGSGKTHVAMAAIARGTQSALILAPTRVLVEQWRERLGERFHGEIGIYGDGERKLGPITISTFESAYRHMDGFGNRFALLVVDEVHHFGGGVRTEALEMCPARQRLGLTATLPTSRSAQARLEELVGPVVFELCIGDLVGEHLSPFTRILMRVNLDPGEAVEYRRLFEPCAQAFRIFVRETPLAGWQDFVRVLSRSERGRRLLEGDRLARRLVALPAAKLAAVESILARQRGRRTLVFTADNDAAYRVSRRLLIPALTCDIGRKEREAVLARLRNGSIRAVVSSRVLNEGLDVPEAEVAVILGGTLGGGEHVQRVGRLLRPAAGKRAVVYELIARGTFEERQAARRGRRLVSRIAAQV